jgi:hypothetical protein
MKLVQPWCLSLAVMLGVGAFTMITPRAASADVIIHIGADVAPAPNPIVYHYVYYPEEEAYFVPETHIYWWSVGGEWRSGPHVPDSIKLGASINLDVDDRDPWRHHEVIVKRYPRHKHEEKEEKHDDKR